jgi:ATPase family protein associated with various cellular activities (AAA)/winged helix domain-containing protein
VTAPPAPEELAATEAWLAANQRSLMAEVEAVRAALLARSGPDAPARPAGTPEPAPQSSAPPPSAPPAADLPSALDAVCGQLSLSGFERQVIVLCAAPELDGRFGEVLGAAQGDSARAYPTFGLALAAFPDAHWSALSPWAPLRRWRLIEPGQGLLTAAPLHIDEWLLHMLTGAGGLDQRLAAVVRPLESAGPAPASAAAAVQALTAAWLRPGPGVPVALRGPARQPKRAIFAAACARLGWEPFVLDGADLPASAAERDELMRLWERGALLSHAALLVECYDVDEAASRGVLERFVDHLAMPAAVAVADGARAGTRPCLTVDAAKPTQAEQRGLWRAALGDDDGFRSLNGTLDRVVAQFDLDAEAIEAAAGRALGNPEAGPAVDAGRRVWDACRRSARGGLDTLAQRLESTATFDDLVLPDAQRELLGDILAHVRFRSRVYEEWQMSGPSRRGLGISALFAGPTGTGKTLAAEVLAGALALDLYRIDLSQVISKYIGETEKNLRRIFEAAGDSGAVLLFDEADALFGRRSEVRDSHDRYANVEISYLLQAMESYRGLAVLTTNMRSALDPAFLRRLRFVVTFPFPGPAERARIWQRAFPPATPTEGLDVARLAQLSVAGGNIRTIALHAAFAAAQAGGPVGMPEVLRAAVAEYAKLERPLSDAEIGGWT